MDPEHIAERLWRVVGELETKIEAQQQKYELALKDKEPEEYIKAVKEEKDRLVQEEEKARQDLSALQAQRAASAGEIPAAAR